MLTLITGLPGNGKSLFALWSVKARAEKEQREVYYYNIKDLNLPWTLFEPEKWMDLPNGSIIVIDEAQQVFPKKPNGSKLPPWYEQLAVHRHKGFDIYLITQHPTLLDNFVRQLVGQHFHAVRKFGMQRATIYEWSAANPAPQNPAAQKSAIPLKWAYPKEVFTWYKSAEVHTVKRSIPIKIVLAALFVVSIAVGLYLEVDHMQNRYRKPGVVPPVAARSGLVSSSVSGGGSRPLTQADKLADVERYVWSESPRVAGLPQTAPKYDELTKPTRVPIPAMCIMRGLPGSDAVTCKCFSQQATPMDVNLSMCMGFARNGFFQDFDADRDRRDSDRTEAGVRAVANVPEQVRPSLAPVDDLPRVVAFADVPSPPRVSGGPSKTAQTPQHREAQIPAHPVVFRN